MGLPLPDELIGLTFNNLDAPSLLKCMQVCRLFLAIISGNTSLVYKIELFASYMEDNEHSSMDTLNRLHILREYNRVWNNMAWTSSGTIPMTNGHCWELSGGILAQAVPDFGVSFVQLPCKLKDIPERRWSVPFEFNVRDFTLDNSQNLIVLLELVGTHPDMVCKIRLRTLTGEHHPNTAVTEIAHASTSLHAEFSFLIQICGNHLGVLLYDQFGASSQNSFLVWDWRTGDRKLHVNTPEFQSFAFMTEDLILAAVLRTDIEPTLQVLRVAEHSYPIDSLEDIPYICELQYPKIQGCLEYLLIRAEPTPTLKPLAPSGVPFYCSRKEFIFTVSLRVLSDEAQQSTVHFIPLSTLLLEVERSQSGLRRKVPWDAWGPSGTRIVCRESSETWVCYTYGMKYIQGLRWKRGHDARVYDFNPYTVRKYAETNVDSPVLWRRLEKGLKPNGRCETFCRQVATSLPGRVATITLEHSDEGWDAVMIGEDHIVMVQPQSSTYGYMAM